MKPLGIYIHIPFCVKKCAYCDFYSLKQESSLEAEYVEAVCNHIKREAPLYSDYCVDTVFFGGGTPSVLSEKSFEKIAECLKSSFLLTQGAEFTVEANPGTLTREKLLLYKKCGVNRLSIGLQSSNEKELSKLERVHTLSDFENSFYMARESGFDNISVDIMYGLPSQTVADFQKTLDYVCKFAPQHLSAYCLKVEPNTPFGKIESELSLPDEDEEYEMYMLLCEYLQRHGYTQYEISNFAKSGFESRHNMKYWLYDDYLSFGPASHSFINGIRYSYPRDINAYIRESKNGIPSRQTETEIEPVLEMEKMDEYVMLRLRLSQGICEASFKKEFGVEFISEYPTIEKFIKSGHVSWEKGRIALTPKGFFVSNYILTEILHI